MRGGMADDLFVKIGYRKRNRTFRASAPVAAPGCLC
jgi:hypothetical protein